MSKMLVFITWSAVVFVSQAAVLDPALYLSPSPPLTGDPGALNRWSKLETEPVEETLIEEQKKLDPNNEPEVPQARTFWSSQPPYGIRGIHIPLTFSLTGSYGTNSGISTGVIGSTYGINTAIPSGVIGSSYASISEDVPSYGKSALAGSSYGLYRTLPGTRVYGGSGGAAWSGWGNGKWGHYGKG